MRQSTINKCPKFRVSLFCYLQESDTNASKEVVNDKMIDNTLQKLRRLLDLGDEDMDPIDAEIAAQIDLPNHDLFDKLIDPVSKVLEMVSTELVKIVPVSKFHCITIFSRLRCSTP